MICLDWIRGLPAEELAMLPDCPNHRLRREDPILCRLGTPAHDSCDECIARFLQTDIPKNEEEHL